MRHKKGRGFRKKINMNFLILKDTQDENKKRRRNIKL